MLLMHYQCIPTSTMAIHLLTQVGPVPSEVRQNYHLILVPTKWDQSFEFLMKGI